MLRLPLSAPYSVLNLYSRYYDGLYSKNYNSNSQFYKTYVFLSPNTKVVFVRTHNYQINELMYVTRVALKKLLFFRKLPNLFYPPPTSQPILEHFILEIYIICQPPPYNVVWKFLMSEFVENLEEGQLFKDKFHIKQSKV